MKVSGSQLASDFKKGFSGNLEEDQLNKMVASLEQVTEAQLAAATSYPATASIAPRKVQCSITGGKTFNSTSGGGPPASSLFGFVYLAGATSLDDLYRRTT